MTNNEPVNVRMTVVLDVRVDDPAALTALAERTVLSGKWADLTHRDEVLAWVRSSPAEALVWTYDSLSPVDVLPGIARASVYNVDADDLPDGGPPPR